jgi:hypothetical protein
MSRLPALGAILAAVLAASVAGAADAPPLPAADKDGWIPLFNGKDLAGWDGDPTIWSVADGCIVGKKEKVDTNTFLIYKRPFSDFTLEAKCLMIKGPGANNSGIQYRSKVIDPAKWIVGGYQADIGVGWWGGLYEERGRGILWKPSPEVAKASKTFDEWNQFVIDCKGPVIKQTLNGVAGAELDDKDEKKRALEGIIALQYHAPGNFEIRFKDIRLKLPK